MPQAHYESIELGCPPEEAISTGILPYPTSGESIGNSIDGSGPLFSMYLGLADEDDKEMVERWKAEAEGVILFAGLFSAAIAALLPVSIGDVRRSSTDIYVAPSAGVNITGLSIRSELPLLTDYAPPTSADFVNSLWLISLVNSLGCAVLATLVQQWARRYIKLTQSRHTLYKRARIRAFFAEGIEKSRLRSLVESLPLLLHMSFLTFFSGLILFLFKGLTGGILSVVVIAWILAFVLVYVRLNMWPSSYNSPYCTVFSSFFRKVPTIIRYILCNVLRQLTGLASFSSASWKYFSALEKDSRRQLRRGIPEAAEESALKLSSEIDGRALVWTLRSLNDDDKQERFFAGIPGFCNSKVLVNPLDAFKTPNGEEMSEALVGFIHRTLSPDFDLGLEVKRRRIVICKDAMRLASLPITSPILERVLYQDWDALLNSVEFGLFLKIANYSDPNAEYHSKCVDAAIIATVQEHDDRWFELATSQLGKSRAVLESYLTNSDSMLLANCIDICRRMIDAYSEHGWDIGVGSRSKYLEIVCKLDARNTLPGLQHDFCCLWNDLIDMTENGNQRIRSLAICILRHIRNIYIDVHQGTDAAPTAFSTSTDDNANVLLDRSSYPSCDVLGHGSHIPGLVIHPTGEIAYAPTIPLPTVTPPTIHDVPSLPAVRLSQTSLRISFEPSLSGVPDTPQLITHVAASSLHTPTSLECQHGPPTSPDVAPACATQSTTDTLTIPSTANSDPHSTSQASTSPTLTAFVPSSHRAVAPHNADLRTLTPSVAPAMSSSALPIPARTNPLPADLPSSSAPPAHQPNAPRSGTPSVSLTPQVTSVPRQDFVLHVPSLGVRDYPWDPDVPTLNAVPHHPHQSELAVPVLDLSRSPLDAVSSPHETDRPR